MGVLLKSLVITHNHPEGTYTCGLGLSKEREQLNSTQQKTSHAEAVGTAQLQGQCQGKCVFAEQHVHSLAVGNCHGKGNAQVPATTLAC